MNTFITGMAINVINTHSLEAAAVEYSMYFFLSNIQGVLHMPLGKHFLPMLRMLHLTLRLLHGDISASISFYCSIPSISIISPVSILSITIPHEGYFHNTSTEVFSQNLDSDSGKFTSSSCPRNYRGSISSVAVQADVGVRTGGCQLEKIGVELQAVHWTCCIGLRNHE